MKNSKLFQLLNRLTLEEKERLEAYVHSPYLNKNKRIKHFCKLLVDRNWNLHHPDLVKEKIYKQVFPTEAYMDENFRVLTSQFLKLTEQFLAMEVWKKDSFIQSYHTLNTYSEKRLNKHFRALYKKAKHQLNQSSTSKDITFFYNKFLLSEINYAYTILNDRANIDAAFYNTMDHFDIYLLANKLRYISTFVNQQNIQHIEERPILFYNEIMNITKEANYQQEEYIRYYSLILYCLTEPENEIHFLKLKTLLLEKHTSVLTKSELREILNMATSYAVRKIKAGNEKYYPHLFDLYISYLKDDTILTGGFIREQHYANIVRIALYLNQLEWAYDFIENYKARLNENIRERVYDQNTFHYLAAIGKHKDAANALHRLNFENNADLINYQILLLKDYFQSDNKEAIESLVNNFRNWIKRNRKMTDNAKAQLRNLFDFSIKIYRIKTNVERKVQTRKKQLRDIQLTIRKTKTRDRKWLLEQVVDLFQKM